MNTAPTGPYVAHNNSHFPSLVQVAPEDRGTYLDDGAMILVGRVIEHFSRIVAHGPNTTHQKG